MDTERPGAAIEYATRFRVARMRKSGAPAREAFSDPGLHAFITHSAHRCRCKVRLELQRAV